MRRVHSYFTNTFLATSLISIHCGCGAEQSLMQLKSELMGTRDEKDTAQSLAQDLDATAMGSAPQCGAELDRITRVTEIEVPAPIDSFKAFRSAPTKDNGAVIAYVENILITETRVRLARVTEQSEVLWNTVIVEDPAGSVDTDKPSLNEVHGVAASPDGFAVLTQNTNRESHLTLVTEDGKVAWQKRVEGGCDLKNTVDCVNPNAMGGEGSVIYVPEQQRYVVYYSVGKNFGPAMGIHQGDNLRYVSRSGEVLDGGSLWGCSHSFNQMLAYNGKFVGAACYWHGAGAGMKLRSFDEVRKHRSSYLFIPADPNDYYHTHMGNLMPDKDGFWWPFTSKIRKDLLFETGWSHSKETTLGSRDIGIAKMLLDDNGAITVGPRVWITDSPDVDEDNVHLHPLDDGMLLLWSVSLPKTPDEIASRRFQWESKQKTFAQRLNSQGTAMGEPVELAAKIFQYAAHGQRQNLFSFANGDIGWAFGDDVTEMKPTIIDAKGRKNQLQFGVYRKLKLARIPTCSPQASLPQTANISVENFVNEGQRIDIDLNQYASFATDSVIEWIDTPSDATIDPSARRISWTAPFERGPQTIGTITMRAQGKSSKDNGPITVEIQLSIVDHHPHQNPTEPLDANNDGLISALDALVLTNAINAGGSRELELPPSEAVKFYYDVNGDDRLGPDDVLRVTNYLNRSEANEN